MTVSSTTGRCRQKRLKEIADKATQIAWEAKREEKKSAGCSTSPGNYHCHGTFRRVPENHAAAVGSKGERTENVRVCQHGLLSDLCSYSHINFAYAELGECEELNIPCLIFALLQQHLQLYDQMVRESVFELNIPALLIDIPRLTGYTCDADRVRYMRAL